MDCGPARALARSAVPSAASVRRQEIPDVLLIAQTPHARDQPLQLFFACAAGVLGESQRLVFELRTREAVVRIAFRRLDLLLERAAVARLHRHAAHPAP